MKCPECGGNLTFHFNPNNHDIMFLAATTTTRYYIRLNFLEQAVLYEVKGLACFANEYENDLIKAMMCRSAKAAQNDRARKQRELDALLVCNKEQDILLKMKKGVAFSYASDCRKTTKKSLMTEQRGMCARG